MSTEPQEPIEPVTEVASVTATFTMYSNGTWSSNVYGSGGSTALDFVQVLWQTFDKFRNERKPQ